MNLCFVLGGFQGVGGIGRVVSILANELSQKAEYNLYFVVMNEWDRGKFLYDLPENVTGIGWKAPKSMKKVFFYGGIQKLKRYLKDNRIDVVIGCGALYFPLIVMACVGIKTKSLCWEHSNANNAADHQFQKICRWIGAKFSDCVVVLTKYDERLYQTKYRSKRIYQVYNPIDPLLFCSKERVPFIKRKIISVGRLTYQKNYPLLIKIANRVLKNHPDWQWHIYGDGPEEESIKQFINENGLSAQLILKGQVRDLYLLYNEYDFFVSTSRYEGFSMAFLEAVANGLPIISFDIECGPREIIEDGKNGFLVAPFDENKFIECIEKIITSGSIREYMVTEQRKKAQIYNCHSIVEQWNRIFKIMIE